MLDAAGVEPYTGAAGQGLVLYTKPNVPAPLLLVALAAAAVLALPSTASAYIGPGAGFALLSSFFVLLTTMVLALVALLRWPFRVMWRAVRGGKARPLIRRLIVIGFDGQEPSLTDRYLEEGKLPHFAALAKAGCYHRLKTTNPPVSRVRQARVSQQHGRPHVALVYVLPAL